MQTSHSRLASSAFALIAISAVTNAAAQVTIDQDSIIRGIGFPLVISEPGSYKLVGNLQVGTGSTGIEITTSGVILDMNGFSIVSGGTCTRDPGSYAVTCHNASNSEIGVNFKAGGNTLRNGSVRGFHTGVQYHHGDLLENLYVTHNHTGVYGIGGVGSRTLIRGVRSELNRDHGFYAHDALIQGSTADSNGQYGFMLSRSLVHESSAYFNKGMGFSSNSQSALSRSVAYGNLMGNIGAGDMKSLGGNLNGASPY